MVTGLGLLLTLFAERASAQRRERRDASAARTQSPALATGAHDVVLNGVRFWYRVAGTPRAGVPPLLFLHGGPGYNSHSFSVLEGPRLEKSLQVIYYDQRGAGRSERPWTGHYSLDTLVEDVEALRRTLGVEQMAVLGHSFGGLLALEYAARYPARVSHLVLAGAFSDAAATCKVHRERFAATHPAEYARVVADSGWLRTARRSDCEYEAHGLTDAEFQAFNNSGIFPDSALQRMQDSVDAASGLRNTGEQSRALMREGLFGHRFAGQMRLTMPTLVLIGAKDYAVGVAPQRMLAAGLSNVEVIEYERAGHFMYLEEPDRFAHDVIRFVTTRPRTRSTRN